jgi:hypothetical protein
MTMTIGYSGKKPAEEVKSQSHKSAKNKEEYAVRNKQPRNSANSH